MESPWAFGFLRFASIFINRIISLIFPTMLTPIIYLVACTLNAGPVPTTQEAISSETDLWGEAALRAPDGPTYDFFAKLLPPLRYVNTEFKQYPIVLSAPLAAQKVRFVSNGSAINAAANSKPMWREVGTPVSFTLGQGNEPFGQDLAQLSGPRYADGWLPIVQLAYRAKDGTIFEQECFAATEHELAQSGTAFVRFRQTGNSSGIITARIDSKDPLQAADGKLLDKDGKCRFAFSSQWKWNDSQHALQADLAPGGSAELIIYTAPAAQSVAADANSYDQHCQACVKTWQDLLARAVALETPEPRVNNAWKALLVGNYMLAVGDRMHYSAGNAYDHLYESECGDAVRAIMLFGHTDQARQMVGPLLDFYREVTRFHVSGHKLQLLSHYYWVTRDKAYVVEKEPVWRPVVDFILSSRGKSNGLLPPDRYAGDIEEKVLSLSSNAACWRGLRDMAAVLSDMGRTDDAARLRDQAAEYRKAILDAVQRSERRDLNPPYIPIALLADEPAPRPLTSTRKGSYYCLMAPYILGSEVLGQNSIRETGLLDYLQQRGGIAMGMIQCKPHQGQFNEQPGVNVLYGLRYMLTLLRRDERDKALVGFYGQLAQAMTPDTFIGGEGSRFLHGDANGRSFYLPPNSASNAMFLETLRYLIVQDWDLDEDGTPDTLRLLYGVPRQWLADGQTVRLHNAPTAFGPVSIECVSHINTGTIDATVELKEVMNPHRSPRSISLRIPVPNNYQLTAATLDNKPLPIRGDQTVELPVQAAPMHLRFTTARKPNP